MGQYRLRLWPDTARRYRPGTFCSHFLYSADTVLRYQPGTNSVPGRYRADTMLTVMAQYWPGIVYMVSARYQLCTGPIQGRYSECNGPLQFIQYRPGTTSVSGRYRADTILTVMAQYWPCIVYTVLVRCQFCIGPIQGRYEKGKIWKIQK